MQSEYSPMQVFYTKSGLRRFEITVSHPGLNKYQQIRGDNEYVVEQKALAKMAQWDDMWTRRQEAEQKRSDREDRAQAVQEKKDLAVQRTQEAKGALKDLRGTLSHTLTVDDTIEWESLKRTSDFPKPRPPKPALPAKPQPFTEPTKPLVRRFRPKLGILDRLFSSRRARKEREAHARFNRALARWKQDRANAAAAYNEGVREYKATLAGLAAEYKKSLATWESERERFLENREEANAAINKKKLKYSEADADAIVDYCDMVLSNSHTPTTSRSPAKLTTTLKTGS